MAIEPYIPPALSDVPRQRWPRHVAIIMDGNGRWAKERGLPRLEGHWVGRRRAREIAEESARLGLEQLTLFAFSVENRQRPADEVQGLMELIAISLVAEQPAIMKNNLRFRTIGRRDGLSETVRTAADQTAALSASNDGMVLCLALNYGGRQEIADAMRRIAARVQHGDLGPAHITEETVAASLDTAGMPDPDLVIRTAGEMRVSNFLLWQISYAEFWTTPKLWPDFTAADLHEAFRNYAGRQRRFGRLTTE
jgi:undecaprenyl diphosphate synthase